MSVRRAAELTVTFEAIDSIYPPARKSGLVIANTSIWISKDGGNFVNTTNGATELTGLLGRYKLTLTAAEMDAYWVHYAVEKIGMQPYDRAIAGHGAPSAVVVADGANTAATFKTNRTEIADDYWKNTLACFMSGSLEGQVSKVTDYNGTTKFVTFLTPFTSAPSPNDHFVLVNI